MQDMASHGLAAAYSAGNDATKEALVKTLVEKLQMAGPAIQAARVDATSKVCSLSAASSGWKARS